MMLFFHAVGLFFQRVWWWRARIVCSLAFTSATEPVSSSGSQVTNQNISSDSSFTSKRDTVTTGYRACNARRHICSDCGKI